MSKQITVTTEHNTQPRGASDEIRWICLTVKAEQDKPTEEQIKKKIKPKPIPDRTVLNISLIDYTDRRFAAQLHGHLAQATREFVRNMEVL